MYSVGVPCSEMREVEIGWRKRDFPARSGLAGGQRSHSLNTNQAASALQGGAVVQGSTFCYREIHERQGGPCYRVERDQGSASTGLPSSEENVGSDISCQSHVMSHKRGQNSVACPPSESSTMNSTSKSLSSDAQTLKMDRKHSVLAAGTKGKYGRQTVAPDKDGLCCCYANNIITIVIVTIPGEFSLVSYCEPSTLLVDTFKSLTTTWPDWGGDDVRILQLRQLGPRGTCLRPRSEEGALCINISWVACHQSG